MKHLVGTNLPMQQKQWKDFFDFEQTDLYICIYGY